MSNVWVNEINIKLTPEEAIDVGTAIKAKLIVSIVDGYDVNKDYGSLKQLCGQLLSIAYGYDYFPSLEVELSKAMSGEEDE